MNWRRPKHFCGVACTTLRVWFPELQSLLVCPNEYVLSFGHCKNPKRTLTSRVAVRWAQELLLCKHAGQCSKTSDPIEDRNLESTDYEESEMVF